MNAPPVRKIIRVVCAGSRRSSDVVLGGEQHPNIYLTEVDAMLQRATTVTQEGAYTRVDYA